MNSKIPGMERYVNTLRAWQLAILRFAVTLDKADGLAVQTIAAHIDGLDSKQDNKPEFSFFRKTSAELCAAIQRPNGLTSTVLQQYLARIDDDRLKRSFAAAMQVEQPKMSSASKPVKRDNDLWRGLSSRSSPSL